MNKYYIIIIISGIVVLSLMDYYLYKCNNRFTILKKYKTNKTMNFIINWAPILLLNICLLLNVTKYAIIMLYFVMSFIICNLMNKLISVIRKKKNDNYYFGIVAIVLSIFAITYGIINANTIVKTEYNISTDKELLNGNLKIAQISDIHLNTTFDGEGFKEILDEIVSSNPDIMFITGDFIDGGTDYESLKKACEKFGNIKLKYGIYYVLGNHDYMRYGENTGYSFDDFIKLLKDNNVKILQDQVELIDNSFYVIGRKDRSMSPSRNDILQLIDNVEEDKYIILLDHQPCEYDIISDTSIDLVLSGHTHAGQLFPVDIINDMTGINDMLYGIKKINNTNFIVSSGLSMWGFDIRTSQHSEYVIINIKKEA